MIASGMTILASDNETGIQDKPNNALSEMEDINFTDAGLWGLFSSAFISSTLLPGGSEALLLWMSANTAYSNFSLLAVASVGNTLGGMTSWLLGFAMERRLERNHPLKDSTQKALARIRKYGSPALLLSWLPVVGDPLCLAAGYVRCNPWLSALYIFIGKAARYAVLIWLEHSLLG